jgi:hypothetical protein
MVNKVLQEVHDDIQIGFRTAENHVEMLKGYSASQSEQQQSSKHFEPTRQEKYFVIPKNVNSEKSYSKDLMPKQIYILYSIYLQRKKMNDEDSKNFFDYITSFLNMPQGGDKSALPSLSIADARAQIGFDTGISLSLNLLKELGTSSPGQSLLISSLKVLLESLKAYRPGALYSVSDRMSF